MNKEDRKQTLQRRFVGVIVLCPDTKISVRDGQSVAREHQIRRGGKAPS